MKTIALNDVKTKIVNFRFIVKCTVGIFFVFVFVFLIMRYPSYSSEGVVNGINICLNTLIPSLYPFMILTNIITDYSYIFEKIPFLSYLSKKVFLQPPVCISVMIFAMIGGLPVGIKMAGDLLKRRLISENQFKRLSLFCMNAGPAFIINTVGVGMLGSEDTGKILYISLILSSLTVGVLSRIFSNGEMHETVYRAEKKNTLDLQGAVVNASKSIIMISSWLIAFSCFNSIIEHVSLSENFSLLIRSVSEITTGCILSAEKFPVYITAGIIGFSGLCGHLQVWNILQTAKMKYRYFFVARVINGSLAVIYSNVLLKLFPPVTETISLGVKPTESDFSTSELIAVLMLIMSVLAILGDDFVIRKKQKNNI